MVCGEHINSQLIWMKGEILPRSSAQADTCCSCAQVWTEQKSWQCCLHPSCWTPCFWKRGEMKYQVGQKSHLQHKVPRMQKIKILAWRATLVTLHGVFTGPDCTLSWVLNKHLRSTEVEVNVDMWEVICGLLRGVPGIHHYQVLHTYSFSVRTDCMDSEASMHPWFSHTSKTESAMFLGSSEEHLLLFVGTDNWGGNSAS